MPVSLASIVRDPVWPLSPSRAPQSQSQSQLPQSNPQSQFQSITMPLRDQFPSCSFSTPRAAAPSSASSSMPVASPAKDLESFICSGPLLRKIGLDSDSVKEGIEEWESLGLSLARKLGFNEASISASERSRIYHYYLPVYMWCKKELELHKSKPQHQPGPVPALVIGISAPQGCGKTTLVEALDYLFNSTGCAAAAVSIDDFYLTAAEQQKLANEHKDNSLLELRGNAGSHDLQLGNETIKILQSLKDGETATIPHYDKSAFSGRGDRADPSAWGKVTGPLQVVLFEGWMLGFKPQETELVKAVDPQLEIVNKILVDYQTSWFSLVDSWIIVQVEDPNWVFNWRLQAELQMKARGKPGMTDEQIADFVARYMPAYKAYLQPLYNEGPLNSKPEKTLQFFIDEQRNPVA